MQKPSALDAAIGGYGGPSYSVTLGPEGLCYEASRDGVLVACDTLDPSAAEWGAFVRALEAAGVWSWQSEYTEADTVDGTSWSVQIRVGSQRVRSYGSNKFPLTFPEFALALSQLVGGREFE